MLVLSSPSGAGKTTISRKLLAADGNISLSVSATTRAMRPGEEHGRDYHFISHDEFAAWAADCRFLEHASVFGHRYGTPAHLVTDALASGRDVLFDIDWQGTQQLRGAFGTDLVRIFILPPSMTELQSRLHRRAEDTEEVIATRLANSRAEIEHWHEYDYVILNDDLDAAFDAVESIVKAERLRRDRRHGMFDFVTKLLTEKPVL